MGGIRICRDAPDDKLRFRFHRRAGWLGSVNSMSSMGAPFSTMKATRTPGPTAVDSCQWSVNSGQRSGDSGPSALAHDGYWLEERAGYALGDAY
jgi:hypothetical protein